MNAPTRRQQYTETAMRHAFLVALSRWAERHADNEQITLPTGAAATAGELVRVVCALGLIDRRAPAD